MEINQSASVPSPTWENFTSFLDYLHVNRIAISYYIYHRTRLIYYCRLGPMNTAPRCLCVLYIFFITLFTFVFAFECAGTHFVCVFDYVCHIYVVILHNFLCFWVCRYMYVRVCFVLQQQIVSGRRWTVQLLLKAMISLLHISQVNWFLF